MIFRIMDAAKNMCVWRDQCGVNCPLLEGIDCKDYTPEDPSEAEEAYYDVVLKENTRLYEKLARQFNGE